MQFECLDMPRLKLSLAIRYDAERKPLCSQVFQNRPCSIEWLGEVRAARAVVREQGLGVLGLSAELVQYGRVDDGLRDVSAPVEDEETGGPFR